MLRWLLQAVLLLTPHDPAARTREVAAAVHRATTNRHEAAALLSIDFHETTFGRRGVRFGLCDHLCSTRCSDCRQEPLARSARVALAIWRRSRTGSGCGVRAGVLERLHWYHTGSCAGWRADRFAATEARTMNRILRGRRLVAR